MAVQTEIDSTFNRDKISLVLQQLDFICRFYTDAMAIKTELQHSLFTENYASDGEEGLNTEAVKNVTKALIYLQTATSILQDVKVFV